MISRRFITTAATTIALLLATMTLLSGCGGGGSSSGVATPPPTGTMLVGTVAKGTFSSGYVETYYVSGAIEVLQRTTTIASNGTFTLDLGTHTGIVLLKAYGTYTNEATNSTVTITKGIDAPLRTVLNLSVPSGTIPVAITPLTELAVRNALARSTAVPAALTQENIIAANALVSDIFPFDVVATRPVSPDALALSSASDSQKCYSLLLCGISQLASTPTLLDNLLASYAANLSSYGRLLAADITNLTTATQTFLSSGYNQSGYATTGQIPLFPEVGYYTTLVTITTVKNSSAASSTANMIQFSLLLDSNLTVDNTANIPNSGVITLLTAVQTTTTAANLTTDSATLQPVLNIALNNSSGISVGALATIKIKTAPSYIPGPSSILVTHLYQSGIEQTLIPYASLMDTNSTTVDWSINATY
ncbi:MAG: hypothetical protein GJT30_04755 [Geobacter sp.]|nr:hypothetical protein [Geobacter sp.]